MSMSCLEYVILYLTKGIMLPTKPTTFPVHIYCTSQDIINSLRFSESMNMQNMKKINLNHWFHLFQIEFPTIESIPKACKPTYIHTYFHKLGRFVNHFHLKLLRWFITNGVKPSMTTNKWQTYNWFTNDILLIANNHYAKKWGLDNV